MGEWGVTASGYEVSFWVDKKCLELAGGDGCTTLWMYLMPLICTLQNGYIGKFYHIEKKPYLKKKKQTKKTLPNKINSNSLVLSNTRPYLNFPGCLRNVFYVDFKKKSNPNKVVLCFKPLFLTFLSWNISNICANCESNVINPQVPITELQ